MKRAVIAAVLALGAAGSACDSKGDDPESVTGLLVIEPIVTIESLTMTPDRGPAGTVATVTWIGGQFTYSVQIKQGTCGALGPNGTVAERSCPDLVGVAENLPASGSITLELTKTGHLCVFPRGGGILPQGRCVLATVLP